MVHQSQLTISMSGRGMTNISADVQEVVETAQLEQGLCHVFIRHTSASLIVCENADDTVQQDLEGFMTRLVTDGDPLFLHRAEGPDDMSAHIRSVLTQTSLSVPFDGGQLCLGTWQGIYLWEHRHRAYDRHIVVSVLG